MKRLLLGIIQVCISSCISHQPILREADEPVLIKNSRQLKPYSIDSQSIFPVKDEGKVVIDLEGQPMNVASDLTLNGDTLHTIRFADAAFHRDTLLITLFELNESSDNFYKIIIVGGKYIAQYDFSTPGDQKNRKIRTIEATLTLNTDDFKKGQIIRGHTEFKGKCNRECWDNPIVLAGNFIVRVE